MLLLSHSSLCKSCNQNSCTQSSTDGMQSNISEKWSRHVTFWRDRCDLNPFCKCRSAEFCSISDKPSSNNARKGPLSMLPLLCPLPTCKPICSFTLYFIFHFLTPAHSATPVVHPLPSGKLAPLAVISSLSEKT